jgi:beta-lactamase regulating signal transducer with metallopeptidase domain
VHVVLNWLTQGVIVAVLAAAALRLIPQSRAQARYGILWTSYLLVLVLPAMPMVVALVVDGPTIDLVPAAAGPVVTVPTAWWASPSAAAGLWITWSCIQAARLGASALGARNVRRRGRECPVSVLARLPHWSRVGGTGRRTRVLLSSEVRAAAVLGVGTPAIAVAPTLIGRLSLADLDRVLVHEWAHVQRRDDVAQLVQRIVRIVVGWHPAAWWLERQLEFEREAACDEIAVSVTGSAKDYATCLATLAALPAARLRSVAALAVASPRRLRARIVRILTAPYVAASRPWRVIAIGGGVALLACTVVVADLQVAGSATSSAPASPIARPLLPQTIVRALPVAAPSVEHTQPGSQPAPGRRQEAGVRPRSGAYAPLPRVDKAEAIDSASVSAEAVTPLPASAWPLGVPVSLPVATGSSERAVQAAAETSLAARLVATEARPAAQARAPWTRAADVGVSIGRASQTAGTATAGFFHRVSKKLAASF